MNKRVSKILVFNLLLWISGYGHCSKMGDKLKGNVTFETLDTRKYLVDFPTLNKESLRFVLPFSDWANHKKILARGVYLKVSKKISGGVASTPYFGPLNFYKTLNFENKPVLQIDNMALKENDKEICKVHSRQPFKMSKSFSMCGSFYCYRHESQMPMKMSNFLGLDDTLILQDSREKSRNCPYHLDFFVDYESANKVFYLKIDQVFLEKEYAEVRFGDHKLYLNINFCKKEPELCEIKSIDLSEFEEAWINLKLAQEKKNYHTLNYFIEKLKPCVLSNDRDCIKKFFVAKKDYTEDEEFSYPVVLITDQIVKDLKKCLSYESLLPFGGRTRAEEDRICIFDSKKNLIYSITLPEAYKTDGLEIGVEY